MKRSRSELKGKMPVRTILKKRRTEKLPLETGDGPGAHEMKEEYNADESGPDTSSTLGK